LTVSSILLAVLALLLAFVVVRLRRVSKRLDRLAESYWQLRYEQGQINARITRLEKGVPDGEVEPVPVAERPATAFVPLSSLRKS
jgi:cell division protein FtsB